MELLYLGMSVVIWDNGSWYFKEDQKLKAAINYIISTAFLIMAFKDLWF